MVGIGTRSESIGMTVARGRTTAVSSATDRISERRCSGIRNPPASGTSDPNEFWIASYFARLAASFARSRVDP
jgi:hypothetical protein